MREVLPKDHMYHILRGVELKTTYLLPSTKGLRAAVKSAYAVGRESGTPKSRNRYVMYQKQGSPSRASRSNYR